MPAQTKESIQRSARDLFDRAFAALDRNNLDYAIEMFRQCLAIEPNFVECRRYLRAAQMKNASGSALKRVVTAAKAAPHLTKAKMAIAKNPGEAMNIAEQVLSDDPKNGQALLLLAEAADTGGYLETTVQTLDHYCKLNPKDTRNLHWLGRAYCATNNYDAARDIYERILELKPADFEAQKALKDVTASGAMHGGGWNEAESYRDIIKDKEEATTLEQESRMVRAEDMVDNLIREQLDKLRLAPDNPVIKRELGKLHAQKGDYDTALQYFDQLTASEGSVDAALEREISDIRAKRIDAAIAAKRKEREEHPANAATIDQEIAGLEQEAHDLRLAEAEGLVHRYPNDLMYRFDYAVLLMNSGQIQEAVEQFQKSVGQPQKRIASLNYLGQCFQQLGLHDLAVEQFSRAIEETPSMDNLKKDLIYNLGTAYESMNDHDKALAEFKKIAAVDYGFRDVREKIMRKPGT